MYVDPQEFGRLEGKVEALKEQVDLNSKKLDDIHTYVTKQKGAANTIHMVWIVVTTAIASAIAYLK